MKNILIMVMAIYMLSSCKTINNQTTASGSDSVSNYILNNSGLGNLLIIEVQKQAYFNHPSMALWLEDTNGKYIQTIYVSKSIASGIFKHGKKTGINWESGPVRRPAALPHWAFQRGVKEEDGLYIPTPKNPIPDAYTGPTPKNDFLIKAKLDSLYKGNYIIKLEINQPWDWNEYWNNNKYPNDDDYKSSSQPALVYAAKINFDMPNQTSEMKVIGHSHYSGKDGMLTTDISTMTTSLKIISNPKITVK